MRPTHPGQLFLTQPILAHLKRLAAAILAATLAAWLLALAQDPSDTLPHNLWVINGPVNALAASSTVVISEFRTRGPSGGNDEFIELYNLTASPIALSGWKINGSNNVGTTNTRLTINAGTTIPAFGHFLATNSISYSGPVAGDQTYSTGISDDGGLALLMPDNTIIDSVGMSSGSAYKEGAILTPTMVNQNQSYERKPGGANGSGQDTDNNSSDFLFHPSSSDPQNLSSLPTPACSSALTVANANDSGAGSLRQAVAEVCGGGTVGFDNMLSGQTIALTGGEIAITKTLTIDGGSLSQHVNISGNSSVRVFNIASGVTVTLADLNLINGQASDGGGIYNKGSLTLTNSTLSGNSASNGGGGIFNDSGATLTVNNSTFSGNLAVYGGGVINWGGMLTINNSTISGNSANGGVGGGIYQPLGVLTVTNSTFSDNSASGSGGSISNYGTLHFSNSLIANSSGGGDCGNFGVIATNLNNLVEDGSCNPTLSGDPRLGPLANNGGDTLTHALLPGSPAIDAGNNGVCLATDQRGIGRPQQAVCDMGAFESRGFSLTVTGGNNQSTLINTAFANPLAVSLGSAFGEPVGPGGVISYAAPASGAGLTPSTLTATTSAGGTAGVSGIANGTPGSYLVTATASGASPPVTFSLTNTFREMTALGNNQVIADGDATPSPADHTDFGNVLVSGGLITRTFTISNSGSTALNLTGSPSISITGAAAAEFVVVVSPATPITPNAVSTFHIRFNPSVAGTRVAIVAIANDDSDENPYDFAIQGVGQNQAPIANAGSDQSVNTNALVTLNGTGSSDPDNDLPLAYGWMQTGGPIVILGNSTGSQPTFIAPGNPAVLTFTLTVTDNLGLADPSPDAIVVTITDSSITGLAAANSSPTHVGNATTFAVTLTGGSNVSYAWDFGDGAGGSGATTSHTYGAIGSYTALVTATNSTNSVTATTQVTITNQAPNADAGSDQNVSTGAIVTLDGSASSDPDSDTPLIFGWTQTGGLAVTLSSATAVSLTFTAPSTPVALAFNLTVTDTFGLADPTPDEVVVNVQDSTPPPSSSATIYLPLIFEDFITMPDLVIDELIAGSGSVTITIRNVGYTPVTDAFWVDVYFNPDPAPPHLNQPWDTIAPAGAVWGVTQTLDPGESLTLTSGGAYYFPKLSSPSFPAGAQVYALVDSINFSTTYGNVPEGNESNNIFGPIISTTKGSLALRMAAALSLEGLPER